jgi:hypothetical protein
MKKIMKLRTVILYSFLSCTVFLILLVNGCNKMEAGEEALTEKTSSLSRSAENHFSRLAENEKAVAAQPSTATKIKSTKNRVTPLSKMSPLILWDKATEFKRDKLTYTIVPLKDDLKKFKDKKYEFLRNIIFYSDESGKKNMLILEVLSKKGGSLGDDFLKIASSAFENKYFAKSRDIDGLNAYVLFYNENYAEDTSFQLVDGKWTPARISFRSDLEITQ